jgi:hypothetical protein
MAAIVGCTILTQSDHALSSPLHFASGCCTRRFAWFASILTGRCCETAQSSTRKVDQHELWRPFGMADFAKTRIVTRIGFRLPAPRCSSQSINNAERA